VKQSLDNLDHRIIAGKVKSQFVRQISYKRLIRDFSHENLMLLNERLSAVPWHDMLFDICNVDDCVLYFNRVL